MTRHVRINESRPAFGGPPTGSLRDTLRLDEIRLHHRSPLAQMLIDLAAVLGIVALACTASVAIVSAGFILMFVKLS